MLPTTVILAALLVVLALVLVPAAVALARARRALAPLALAHVQGEDARDHRIIESLVEARAAVSLVHSGAERSLWAVTRFDARADRLEAALRSQRETLDKQTVLVAGMRPRIERLRSLAALVFDR